MKFDTALLHGNFDGDKNTGATLAPIYQSSAFYKESAEHIEKIFHNQAPGFAYSRISNPTVDSFEQRMTCIENGLASVAVSSGMAAISMTLLNILSSGDEIISTASVFGGTLDLFADLEAYGIKTRFVKSVTKESLKQTVTECTRAVFAETIGNPKLDVTDVAAAAGAAHEYNLPFILDNTSATAYLLNGISRGADIVINSSSKYINGSSNSVSGVITDSGKYKWTEERYPSMKDYIKYGKFAFIAKLRNDTYRNIGCCLSPMNAYLNSLGLETLSLRMERHCQNAERLACHLENQEGIRAVNYPTLKSSPYRDLAMRQLGGKGGGIITLRLYTKERAFAFINHLKYAVNITNIGDTKTLVVHPASTIYAHSDDEGRKNAGVYDDLVRVSVGIEDCDDLISDFTEALEYVNEKYSAGNQDISLPQLSKDKICQNHAEELYALFIEGGDGFYEKLNAVSDDCTEPELGEIYLYLTNRISNEYDWLDLYISTIEESVVTHSEFVLELSKLFKIFKDLYPAVNNSVISEVINYILNNPESDLKQKTIASELYINNSYLSTVFAAQTNMRFVDYLTTVKMRRAAQLLKATNLKVSDIAQRLDYKDIGYFSKMFKKQFGMTPTEFRLPDNHTYQI